MTLVAVLILRGLSPASDYFMAAKSGKAGKRIVRRRPGCLQGHARSGCASPPELASLMENGIYATPPY
jgi:hypothetical protein